MLSNKSQLQAYDENKESLADDENHLEEDGKFFKHNNINSIDIPEENNNEEDPDFDYKEVSEISEVTLESFPEGYIVS